MLVTQMLEIRMLVMRQRQIQVEDNTRYASDWDTGDNHA